MTKEEAIRSLRLLCDRTTKFELILSKILEKEKICRASGNGLSHPATQPRQKRGKAKPAKN